MRTSKLSVFRTVLKGKLLVNVKRFDETNLASIVCFRSQSTTKSHSFGANVQTVLSLMKAHNPALCNAAVRRAQKRYTTSAGSTPRSSDSENAFDELLLGLQDEFGHITLYVC